MLARMFPIRRYIPATAAFTLSLLVAGCASQPTPSPRYSPPDQFKIQTVAATPIARPTPAPTVEIKSTAPEQYVVKTGDTLWDIASQFLKDPWYWPEIWHVNRQIANPHLIYPGDVLSLYYVDGKPYIKIGEGPRIGGGDIIELGPRVRTAALEQSSARVPIQAIQQFITRPRVVSKEQLDDAPYLIGAQDDRLIYGSGDRVYARGASLLAGERYSVFRPGKALIDPVTDELLGFEAILVSDATVLRRGDPSTVLLENNEREALKGDRLLSHTEERDHAFFPRAPEREVNGIIISLFDAISQIGQHQVAVLNVGERNGIQKGHVLATHQAGRVVHDPYAQDGQSKSVVLPSEKTGVMMVFRTFPKVSYALVMDATRPMHIGDNVRPPE